MHPSTGSTPHGKLTMAITERERRDIYTGLEQTLGEQVANNLMQLLPHQPTDQLVTRTDLHAFGSELRAEFKGEMAEIRGEMAELRGEMAELRGDFKSEMAKLRVDTQRLMVGAMAANTVALVVALLT
jgi:hypothetical protein